MQQPSTIREPHKRNHPPLSSDSSGVVLDTHTSLLAALEESERKELRWRYALEGSNQGVWDHDFASDTMYYSPSWRAIRGLGPDCDISAYLKEWLKNVHPDDQEFVLSKIDQQNSGEKVFSIFEYRERHANGRWIWIESRGSVVSWFENGKPSRIVGTDTDISARKNAEATIDDVSRRLRLALDASGVGVFEANLETGEVERDQRLLQIYGIEEFDAASARNMLGEHLHPEERSVYQEDIDQGTGPDGPMCKEFCILTPKGDVRHIRSRSLIYTNAIGERRLIGANWDVTHDVALMDDLERARNRIESLVYQDELTGLANRRGLTEQLSLWERVPECYVAVIHVDLDRFKSINDTMGHRVGDAMLKHAANTLRALVGGDDFIARIGGDEFVILCARPGNSNALSALAQDIVSRLRTPVIFEDQTCRFGASVGLAWASSINVLHTFVDADIALSHAKALGRNQVQLFTPRLQEEINNNKRLADEIAVAVETNQFVPFYQPQYFAKSLRLAGLETLARWNHPSRGIITPDGFLKVANEIDLIAAIDKQIADAAIGHFNDWRASGLIVPRLAVNVSARRLQDPWLIKAMSADHVPKTGLSFELLESMFLDDLGEDAHKVVSDLKDLGIDIEIDDFGTGHASIVGLLKLSPKRLKIDRSIIGPIVHSKEQRALVRSIIEIGHSLGIEVIAEGVETKSHIKILQRLNCDILQGFVFGRPMSNLAIESFLGHPGNMAPMLDSL